MKKVFYLILCSLFLSCTRITYKAGDLVSASIDKKQIHRSPFKIEIEKEFYLWGIVPRAYEISLDQVLYDHGIIEASNIKVSESIGGLNYLKSIFTFGMLVPLKVTVEGVGIKIDEESL